MQVVEIEATNRCNTHCLHCPREAIRRPMGSMSWEVFEAIAAQIVACHHFDLVNFSGMGEPTLNPFLPRFISYFSSQGIPSQITTNLSTLTQSSVQSLLDAGLTQIVFSFNGHTSELYAQMTGGQSLSVATETIRYLVSLGCIRLAVNVSVTKQTQAYLDEIRAYLNDLGVQGIYFSLCHNRGGYLRDASVCATPLPPIGHDRCDIFADTLFIAWNGHVLACCHDLEAVGDMGDLSTTPIGAILEKKRQMILEGRLFPMCSQCNDLYRFENDPTPDRMPLSEWIYQLYSEKNSQNSALISVIRRQETRIAELERLVAAYERGRFIRLANWLHRLGSWFRMKR